MQTKTRSKTSWMLKYIFFNFFFCANTNAAFALQTAGWRPHALIKKSKLEDEFYAARCNSGELGISKPLEVSVETSPNFLVNHLEGMPVRSKDLVPVTFCCKIVDWSIFKIDLVVFIFWIVLLCLWQSFYGMLTSLFTF